MGCITTTYKIMSAMILFLISSGKTTSGFSFRAIHCSNTIRFKHTFIKSTGSITDNNENHGSNEMISDDDDNYRFHKVLWNTADDGVIEFTAKHGELLRTAALRNGKISPHNGRANIINCRGLGTCGTCAVEIESINSNLPPRNKIESIRLSVPPGRGPKSVAKTNLRLACVKYKYKVI